MEGLENLINFCDPIFETVVTSSSVCSDGYDVTNLVSPTVDQRQKGFMADRFIKPPVEVTISFPCEISVCYIQISPQVGQQKSIGFEVLSNFKPYSRSWYSGPTPPVGSPVSGGSVFSERIGFSFLREMDSGVVFYCPQKYGRIGSVAVPVGRPDYQQKSLTWMRRAAIANTSSLVIRITKTSNSSVPAIGRIEIWGEPSSCLLKEKAADVLQQWKSRKELPNIPFKVSEPISPRKRKQDSSKLMPGVPEEFLDAITYEIMALPMVLPSGKVVDQSTLEQHANNEANWGRQPSDPFTGLPFSHRCRPILDASLRARIDKYLIDNQHQADLRNVPRTVGRAKPSLQPQNFFQNPDDEINKTVGQNQTNTVGITRKMPNAVDISECKWMKAFSGFKNIAPQPHIPGFKKITPKPHIPVSTSLLKPAYSTNTSRHKRMKLEICESAASQSKGEHNQLNDQLNKVSDNVFMMQRKENSSSTKPSTSSCVPDEDVVIIDISKSPTKEVIGSKTPVCHERRLGESLDSAIKAALQGKPSFTQVQPPMPKPVYIQCGSCKVEVNLFRLPCKHFLCRKCLLCQTQGEHSFSVCGVCNAQFKSSEPERFHV